MLVVFSSIIILERSLLLIFSSIILESSTLNFSITFRLFVACPSSLYPPLKSMWEPERQWNKSTLLRRKCGDEKVLRREGKRLSAVAAGGGPVEQNRGGVLSLRATVLRNNFPRDALARQSSHGSRRQPETQTGPEKERDTQRGNES